MLDGPRKLRSNVDVDGALWGLRRTFGRAGVHAWRHVVGGRRVLLERPMALGHASRPEW